MKRIALFLAWCILLAGRGFAQSDLQPAAIVNLTKSEPITVKQFRTEVERMEKAAGRALSAEERTGVLDVMINERLAIQAAERDRITISENEVNQQIQELRAEMGQAIGRSPSDAEFTQALKNQTGLEMPAFREQLRRQLIVQKYLMTKKQSMFEAIQRPRPDEIVRTYNLSKTRLIRPETVRFSFIQIPYGADAASKAKAKQLADRLVRDIGSNATKFDEAVARGQAPNAGYQAGDGGFLPRDLEADKIVGQAFLESAFSLRQGQVSRLIEGKQGYQIIKITEKYEQKQLDLDDIYLLGTRMTVRDFIGNGLLQERRQETLTRATQELVTELRSQKSFQVFDRNLKW